MVWEVFKNQTVTGSNGDDAVVEKGASVNTCKLEVTLIAIGVVLLCVMWAIDGWGGTAFGLVGVALALTASILQNRRHKRWFR
jgi:hypothetical protein